jgi:predicted thioredoxin/glutaredoxin
MWLNRHRVTGKIAGLLGKTRLATMTIVLVYTHSTTVRSLDLLSAMHNFSLLESVNMGK